LNLDRSNMKHWKLILCLVSLGWLCNPSLALSQDGPYTRNNPYWITLGLGGSSVFDNSASSVLAISAQKRHQLLSLRLVHNSEFLSFSSPDERVWDVGLLYGGIARGRYGFMSLSGGISMVGGVRRGEFVKSTGFLSSEHKKDRFFTVGLPIEAQLFWTPSQNFGIGLYGFSNINKEETFTGVALAVQISYR
jgi:hypothetical protein